MQVAITDIKIGERFRKYLGDIDDLAADIKETGLVQPVVISSDNMLIAGKRRLAAAEKLGWETIECVVVDLESIVKAERSENAKRLDFLPTEAVAITKAIEELERDEAKGRQVEAGKHGGEGTR